jgi:leucyl-tRNA synthetase
LKFVDWPISVKTLQQNWIRPQMAMILAGSVSIDSHIYPMECHVVTVSNTACISSVCVGPLHPILGHLNDPEISNWCNTILDQRNQSHDPLQARFSGLYLQTEFGNIPIWIGLNLAQDPFQSFASFQNDEFSKHNQIWDSVTVKLSQQREVYGLRDWLISRQRTWGTPIPILNCPSCKHVPVPIHSLPVLPHTQLPCPSCGQMSTLETDTMDTFMDSSWYWLRYLDPNNSTGLIAKDKSRPVDIYIGGKEHAIMHLLYARFIAKFLNDQGIISIPQGEPFFKFVPIGVVKNTTFKCPDSGAYLPHSAIQEGLIISTKKRPIVTNEKMSKSKLNGVDPIDLIEKHGSDCVRLYMLSRSDVKLEILWDDSAISGISRFLHRLNLMVENPPSQSSVEMDALITKVTKYMDQMAFHKAVGILVAVQQVSKNDMIMFLQLLYPFAPVISVKLLNKLDRTIRAENITWPVARNVSCRKTLIMINNKKIAELKLDDVLFDRPDDLVLYLKRLNVLKSTPKKMFLIKKSHVINFLV